MQLTHFSNYAVRTLMYCALKPGQVCRVRDIANAYGISEHHLMKVVQTLGQMQLIDTLRGRGGGIRLAKDPHDIVIGQVLRVTEGNLNLAECFDEATNTCPLRPACRFKLALTRALEAFFLVLEGYTLADFICHPHELAALLKLSPDEPEADLAMAAN
ncbi:MAG: Rrf2 family transcriptional regulator [Geminicoccaceae bacterium]|nr:MAG: Rrf2 family transcriptional regulator [Geminicoccaceae bacterium]